MNTSPITVEAVLQPDGLTLSLEKKVTLPPGRVMVTVQQTGARPGPVEAEPILEYDWSRARRKIRAAARAYSEQTHADY